MKGQGYESGDAPDVIPNPPSGPAAGGRGTSSEDEPRVMLCPTRTPEPHQLGEFPMTCYRCHVDADS